MIQLGDVIKLRPSIFKDTYTKDNVEWRDEFLYEDQFSYVSLWFHNLNQPGEMAKSFFGESQSRIIDVEYLENGEPLIVLTTNFRIIYPKAVESKEFSIIPYKAENYYEFVSDKELIEQLEFFEKEYLNGLFNIMERENNKIAMYRQNFYHMIYERRKNFC